MKKAQITTIERLKWRLFFQRYVLGLRIIFLTGAFDIIHLGHTRYFEKAVNLGGILIVGLRSDEWIRQQKGEGRPTFNWDIRAEVLSSLRSIRYIINIDSLPEMHEIIKELNPHIIVVSETDEGTGKDPKTMRKIHGKKVISFPPQAKFNSTDLIKT